MRTKAPIEEDVASFAETDAKLDESLGHGGEEAPLSSVAQGCNQTRDKEENASAQSTVRSDRQIVGPMEVVDGNEEIPVKSVGAGYSQTKNLPQSLTPLNNPPFVTQGCNQTRNKEENAFIQSTVLNHGKAVETMEVVGANDETPVKFVGEVYSQSENVQQNPTQNSFVNPHSKPVECFDDESEVSSAIKAVVALPPKVTANMPKSISFEPLDLSQSFEHRSVAMEIGSMPEPADDSSVRACANKNVENSIMDIPAGDKQNVEFSKGSKPLELVSYSVKGTDVVMDFKSNELQTDKRKEKRHREAKVIKPVLVTKSEPVADSLEVKFEKHEETDIPLVDALLLFDAEEPQIQVHPAYHPSVQSDSLSSVKCEKNGNSEATRFQSITGTIASTNSTYLSETSDTVSSPSPVAYKWSEEEEVLDQSTLEGSSDETVVVEDKVYVPKEEFIEAILGPDFEDPLSTLSPILPSDFLPEISSTESEAEEKNEGNRFTPPPVIQQNSDLKKCLSTEDFRSPRTLSPAVSFTEMSAGQCGNRRVDPVSSRRVTRSSSRLDDKPNEKPDVKTEQRVLRRTPSRQAHEAVNLERKARHPEWTPKKRGAADSTDSDADLPSSSIEDRDSQDLIVRRTRNKSYTTTDSESEQKTRGRGVRYSKKSLSGSESEAEKNLRKSESSPGLVLNRKRGRTGKNTSSDQSEVNALEGSILHPRSVSGLKPDTRPKTAQPLKPSAVKKRKVEPPKPVSALHVPAVAISFDVLKDMPQSPSEPSLHDSWNKVDIGKSSKAAGLPLKKTLPNCGKGRQVVGEKRSGVNIEENIDGDTVRLKSMQSVVEKEKSSTLTTSPPSPSLLEDSLAAVKSTLEVDADISQSTESCIEDEKRSKSTASEPQPFLFEDASVAEKNTPLELSSSEMQGVTSSFATTAPPVRSSLKNYRKGVSGETDTSKPLISFHTASASAFSSYILPPVAPQGAPLEQKSATVITSSSEASQSNKIVDAGSHVKEVSERDDKNVPKLFKPIRILPVNPLELSRPLKTPEIFRAPSDNLEPPPVSDGDWFESDSKRKRVPEFKQKMPYRGSGFVQLDSPKRNSRRRTPKVVDYAAELQAFLRSKKAVEEKKQIEADIETKEEKVTTVLPSESSDEDALMIDSNLSDSPHKKNLQPTAPNPIQSISSKLEVSEDLKESPPSCTFKQEISDLSTPTFYREVGTGSERGDPMPAEWVPTEVVPPSAPKITSLLDIDLSDSKSGPDARQVGPTGRLRLGQGEHAIIDLKSIHMMSNHRNVKYYRRVRITVQKALGAMKTSGWDPSIGIQNITAKLLDTNVLKHVGVVPRTMISMISLDKDSPIVETTQPIPSLTSFQQNCIALLLRLEEMAKNKNNLDHPYIALVQSVLIGLHYTIFESPTNPQQSEINNYCRFHTALAKCQGRLDMVRSLILDLVYHYQAYAADFVFTICSAWPEVLRGTNHPQGAAVFEVVMAYLFTNNTKIAHKGFYGSMVNLLDRQYKLTFNRRSPFGKAQDICDFLVEMLKKSAENDELYIVCTCFSILCRWEGLDFACKEILDNRLWPLLLSWRQGQLHQKAGAFTVLAVGMVARLAHQQGGDRINRIREILMKIATEDVADIVRDMSVEALMMMDLGQKTSSVYELMKNWKGASIDKRVAEGLSHYVIQKEKSLAVLQRQ